ncbi:MAG TPA: pantoate kinase [Candidatus Thermoplasmatota archaeon]|nr:pantoate kinase [Candidatus Thermoplasmatota archaeon]
MSLTGPRHAAAFAPGHITGFFQIFDRDPEIAKRGSRGAGLCLDRGAVTLVEVAPSPTQQVEVFINKAPSEAPVTRAAIQHLLQRALLEGKVDLNRDAPRGERAKVHIRVHTELHLPVSQGFGMSAAGALSTSLALAKALGLGRSDAALAAHAADISEKGGLGDVAGALTGGFEIRKNPGLPPWGFVERLVGYGDVVLCVIGGPLETKKVLADRERAQKINAAGGRCVDELLRGPSLERFMRLSREFAEESGLMTPVLAEAADAVRSVGHASMSMLGNSVFALGKADPLADALEPYGEILRCGIGQEPAHLLQVEVPSSSGQP